MVCHPNSGAKGYRMALRKFRNLIETYEFGAQFSIFSGFSLVLTAMNENDILQQLIGELADSRRKRKLLFKRIRRLLREERAGNQSASDGSIAAYLYCLWRADLETGYRASLEALKTPGLWWCAKLALLVRSQFLAQQISSSIQFTSVGDGSAKYALSDREHFRPDFTKGAYIESVQDSEFFGASHDYLFGSTETIILKRQTELSPSTVYVQF